MRNLRIIINVYFIIIFSFDSPWHNFIYLSFPALAHPTHVVDSLDSPFLLDCVNDAADVRFGNLLLEFFLALLLRGEVDDVRRDTLWSDIRRNCDLFRLNKSGKILRKDEEPAEYYWHTRVSWQNISPLDDANWISHHSNYSNLRRNILGKLFADEREDEGSFADSRIAQH